MLMWLKNNWGVHVFLAFILAIFLLPFSSAGLLEVSVNSSEDLVVSEDETIIQEGTNLNLYVRLKGAYREAGNNNTVESITINVNFRNTLTSEAVKDIVATQVDYGDGELIPKEIGSDDITGYRIKGMWYFDKRRGELMYRLLGIMPIGEDLKNLDGDEEKKTNLFWIWYPSIREILHKELVFNDTSNANQISFDQLLLSRRFSSYIYKEDNIYGDRSISQYKNKGLESILESERIKKEILDFEQDLWNR